MANTKQARFTVERIESDTGEGTMVRVMWGLCRDGRVERTFADEDTARNEAARLNRKTAEAA